MNSIPNLEEVSCNLCGLKEEKIIFKTDMGNVVRCKNCGLYYRTPRLSGREEIHRYEQLAYEDSYCQILNRARERIFISALKKLESRKGRILDIGCADGHFLALAKERGWETFGVEISRFFVKKAREKLGEPSIFGMPLKMAKFPSDFFDTVTMWDVLDQLLDPMEELQEIKRILKKGGVLVIRVRNMSFHLFISRLLNKNIFGFIRNLATCHLYGFNRENMKALLEKANFSKTKIINSKLTVGDPYSQINFMGGSSIALMKEMYYVFSEFLSFFSGKKILISPSLLIYAQKK